jgi:hypothetical protein
MAAHRRLAFVALTVFLVALFSSYRLFASASRPSRFNVQQREVGDGNHRPDR